MTAAVHYWKVQAYAQPNKITTLLEGRIPTECFCRLPLCTWCLWSTPNPFLLPLWNEQMKEVSRFLLCRFRQDTGSGTLVSSISTCTLASVHCVSSCRIFLNGHFRMVRFLRVMMWSSLWYSEYPHNRQISPIAILRSAQEALELTDWGLRLFDTYLPSPRDYI